MNARKMSENLRTWVEVDKKAIRHNYHIFRKLIPKHTKLLGVVKSNAYGHNVLEFTKELEKLGIDRLGVDSLVEGLAIREQGVKIPILVLGHTLPRMISLAVKNDIAITISNFHTLFEVEKMRREKISMKIHIKIDTGMHRQGFQIHEAENLLELLIKLTEAGKIEVDGVYTHFAEAKDPRSGDRTRRQIKEFDEWIALFRDSGFSPVFHASATGGTLLYPKAHYDMVRVGIGLYGLWPSKEAERHLSHKLKLKPVLSWRAVVSEVKDVKKGERVGYDLTEMLLRNTRLAIIPIGYWHGFPRLLSGRGRVLIGGRSARVLGRVSMDMIVVDVTDIKDVRPGSVATMIGQDGKEVISAAEVADFAATTHYEIVTRLNPLMKKIYR